MNQRIEIVGNEFRDRSLLNLKKKSKVLRVELVERDLKVIEFILDMKFAGYAEVFEKFFARTLRGVEAQSEEWARKRLRQLEKAGFLRAGISVTGGPWVYSATFKGYYALTNVYPERIFTKPTGGLDTRTFIHDKELLLARLELERLYGEVNWISDRKLRQDFGKAIGLSGVHVPDGLYEVQNEGLTAFELEIASKTKALYAIKIARYVRLIRESLGKPGGLKKVHYRCLRHCVFEALKEVTRPYGEMFFVEFREPLSNRAQVKSGSEGGGAL